MDYNPAAAKYLSPNDQSCKNCQCYHVMGTARGAAHICRRNPPAAVPVHVQNPAAMLDPKQPPVLQGFQSMYPPTDPNQWCGEWRMKVEGEA